MTLRILLTAAVFLSLSCTLQAQFSAGLSGGVNRTYWSWYMFNPAVKENLPPGTSWRIAIPLEYRLSPVVSLRAELTNQMFCQAVTTVMFFPSNPQGSTQKIRIQNCLNSIGGSLLLKIAPLKKLNKLYLLSGPTYAYFTHGWTRYSRGFLESEDKPWKDAWDLDQSLVLRRHLFVDSGLGYNLTIGRRNRLLLEFRYQYGLTDVSGHPNEISDIQSALVNFGYLYSF